MRQLWPLNRASLETGPFYPFDNGPNGVNTLVAPQWLTRYVLVSGKPYICLTQRVVVTSPPHVCCVSLISCETR